MVKLIACVATVLALGQAAAAAKAVSSFSEWVEGIVADPEGDNMTPEEVMDAFMSGQFGDAPAAQSLRNRDLIQKRATCYEQGESTWCLIADAVTCINRVARQHPDSCKNKYNQCQVNTAIMTTDGRVDSSCNDIARGGGFILDHCVRAGFDWVQGSEFAYGNGNCLVRLRRP